MKKSMISFFLGAVALGLSAQSVEIEGIKGLRFNGVHNLGGGTDMKSEGYYTYYMLEKEKGMKTFEFSIVNTDVSEVKKYQVEIRKGSTFNTAVFNGKVTVISWEDWKNKKLVLSAVDDNGKQIAQKDFPVEKRGELSATVYADKSGNGFYISQRKKAKGGIRGYALTKVDNELKTIWTNIELPSRGVALIADLVNTEDRFVIWEENGMGIKKLKPSIKCFDAKTGKKIYTHEGYDGESTILYNKLRIEEDGSVILGGAYVEGEKYRTVNNNGIYIKKLDKNGKKVLYSKVGNKEKIQPVLRETSKGFTIGSKDKIFVEDLILEGEYYYVISEMFRKNILMTPAAIQQPRDLITGKWIGDMGHDSKPVTFQIMDFMLFKFDQTGKLVEIKPISKEKYNKITCYYPYNGMFGMTLARALSEAGWFDYQYVQKDQEGIAYMVTANNATARKPDVYFYNLEQNYAKKKLNMKQDAKINLEKGKVSYFKTLRGNPGEVATVYYQRKLKRITINLESID